MKVRRVEMYKAGRHTRQQKTTKLPCKVRNKTVCYSIHSLNEWPSKGHIYWIVLVNTMYLQARSTCHGKVLHVQHTYHHASTPTHIVTLEAACSRPCFKLSMHLESLSQKSSRMSSLTTKMRTSRSGQCDSGTI